ncbi:MAG TPA: MarR family transcriptional regulator [Gaiellaceae bacterium]
MSAWVRLLRAHAATTRAFNAELLNEHGLTINDFEALLRLSRAEEGRMRRVDLAENLLLTASGVTRLLDGLEAHGLVERAACSSDRRVVYAVITEEGRKRLQAASDSHVASVTALFEQQFGEEELDRLAELLGRLPGADESAGSEDCSP